MRTHKALHLAALLLALTPCIGLAQTVQPTLKLQVISGVPVFDGVYLNGQGPFRFLLDTGSQGNQMNMSLASKLGLSGSTQLQLQSPAGTITDVPATTVGKVVLGPVEASDQEFLLSKRDTADGLPGVQGILGQRFLHRFDYTLDLRHKQLTFGPPPLSGNRAAFRFASGCMVLSTNLGDLLLDSGTDTLFLFRMSPQLSTVSFSTTTGGFDASIATAPSVKIAGKAYYPREAAFHPVPQAPAAGLLPASLFHAIYISNSDGYVLLNPNE